MIALVRLVATLGFLPPRFRLPAWLAFGVFAGLGLATAHLARVPAYLSDTPSTCVNCHVMGNAYLTWTHGSHAKVASCNDCHVPHDTLLNQYAFKAQDGMVHATVFTLRAEPQVIRLSQRAVPVVEANCLRCHASLVDQVHLRARSPGDKRCWDCHRETPHGRVQSLSAAAPGNVPSLPRPLADPRHPAIHDRAPGTPHPAPTQAPAKE